MAKKKIILTGIILILVASIFPISAFLIEDLTYQLKEIESNKLFLELSKDYYPFILDFEKIENIAQEVANSHEYELHVFDCTDFSKELKKRLIKEGYKARCTAGKNYLADYQNHTWISVWINNKRFEIESTGGYFISNEDFKNYEILWEDYCW